MNAQQKSIAPASAIWIVGAVAAAFVVGAHFAANQWVALGLAALLVALAAYLATSQGPGTAVEFAFKLVEVLLGKEKVAEVNKGVLARI